MIVAALALARGVERDGNEGVDGRGGHPRVVECVGQPVGERAAEVFAFVVFEIVNQISHQSTGVARGHGASEMHGTILTIRAAKFRFDRAIKWMRAALTKRRFYAPGELGAFRAEIAGFETTLAADTERRDE